MHLTVPHERALSVVFGELTSEARELGDVPLRSLGTIAERSNAEGTRYWVLRYSDNGRRREEYIGKVTDPAVQQRIDALRGSLAARRATLGRLRLLSRAGYAVVEKKAFYTLASLHNHGLFRAGAFVVGSHAYGALLNVLAIRAAPYKTEDIDVARRETLALTKASPLMAMLQATGIDFVPVPELDPGRPSSSFKERGRSHFRVDLLVPSPTAQETLVPVPELGSHATGLPYLSYLLQASEILPILSTHGMVPVRVPTPERYAVHKLIVSQLRRSTDAKTEKDLHQAAVLIDALADLLPGAVGDAIDALPRSATSKLQRGIKALRSHLPATAEAAWESLQ